MCYSNSGIGKDFVLDIESGMDNLNAYACIYVCTKNPVSIP